MANIKSQIKRIDVGARNNARRSARKSEARTAIKKVEEFATAKDKEAATKALHEAISLLDKLAQDGIISVNGANRKKAHLEGVVAKI